MTDSIAFGGLRHRNRYPVAGPTFTWTPREDIGVVSLLLMPGQYNVSGGVIGRWTDLSGYARHAQRMAASVPTANAQGCPVFDGTTYLDIASSVFDTVAVPPVTMTAVDNGTMIVVSKQTSALDSQVLPYANPATISGTGAAIGLYQYSLGAKCTGYDAVGYVDAFAAGGVFAAGEGHVQVGAWDSIGLYCAADSLTLGTVTPYNAPQVGLTAFSTSTYIGRGYSSNFTGTIYAVAVYPTKVTDQTVSNWTRWARAVGFVA
jgi:hypothetical protein